MTRVAIGLACVLLLGCSLLWAADECHSCNDRGRITSEEACDRCDGDGELTCTICRGAGEAKCKECDGDGQIKIVRSKKGSSGETGSRFQKCRPCDGGGRATCHRCNGTRGIPCVKCQSKGSVTKSLPCPNCKKGKTEKPEESDAPAAIEIAEPFEERDFVDLAGRNSVRAVREDGGVQYIVTKAQISGPARVSLDPDGDELNVRLDPRTGELLVEWLDAGKRRVLRVKREGDAWAATTEQPK